MLSLANFNIGTPEGISDISKDEKIKDIIEEIVAKYEADIYFLQEIYNADLLHLKGYHIVSKGEVAIIISLDFENIKIIDLNVKWGSLNDNQRIIMITCDHKDRKYLCISIHAPIRDNPNSGTYQRTNALLFCRDIFEGKIDLPIYDDIILAGDFNTSIRTLKESQRIERNKNNPLKSIDKYLVIDPSIDTTRNGRSIDAIYFKGQKVESYETKNIDINKEFDHYLQLSILSFKKKEIQPSKNIELYEVVRIGDENLVLCKDDRKYYQTQSGNKIYVKNNNIIKMVSAMKIAPWSLEISGKCAIKKIFDFSKDKSLKVEAVYVSDEWREVFTDKMGGKSYISAGGNRRKIEGKEIFMVPSDAISQYKRK